jgi:hypothetical protein
MEIRVKGVTPIVKSLSGLVTRNGQALSLAMNRANVSGRKEAIKAGGGVRKIWVGILTKDLKKYTYMRRANSKNTKTAFVITSKPVNLIHFGAIQKGKGVSYKLKKKRRTMKGSFIAKGMVLKRKGKARTPLTAFFSITPTTMFLKAKGDDI